MRLSLGKKCVDTIGTHLKAAGSFVGRKPDCFLKMNTLHLEFYEGIPNKTTSAAMDATRMEYSCFSQKYRVEWQRLFLVWHF